MIDNADTTAEASDIDVAFATGLDRGWDHANFVEAYGPEHGHNTPAYPGWVANGSEEVREAFAEAWELGADRFNEGLYPDGSEAAAAG
jgi:hypothetical protein